MVWGSSPSPLGFDPVICKRRRTFVRTLGGNVAVGAGLGSAVGVAVLAVNGVGGLDVAPTTARGVGTILGLGDGCVRPGILLLCGSCCVALRGRTDVLVPAKLDGVPGINAGEDVEVFNVFGAAAVGTCFVNLCAVGRISCCPITGARSGVEASGEEPFFPLSMGSRLVDALEGSPLADLGSGSSWWTGPILPAEGMELGVGGDGRGCAEVELRVGRTGPALEALECSGSAGKLACCD